MQKFDEMYAMLPDAGPTRWQRGDVRAHYKRYAQWLARKPGM
jgi:hypothetical protein